MRIHLDDQTLATCPQLVKYQKSKTDTGEGAGTS